MKTYLIHLRIESTFVKCQSNKGKDGKMPDYLLNKLWCLQNLKRSKEKINAVIHDSRHMLGHNDMDGVGLYCHFGMLSTILTTQCANSNQGFQQLNNIPIRTVYQYQGMLCKLTIYV